MKYVNESMSSDGELVEGADSSQ